jgi:transcriptional regulator with XRE-family HTH domain
VGERFANRLQRLRQTAGLSQPQLAAIALCPVGTLRNWEQGRRLPYLDTAVRLAKALNVTLDELAGDADDMHDPEAPAPSRPGRPRKTPAPADDTTASKPRKAKK